MLFFRSCFRFTAKLREGRDFPCTPCSQIYIDSPIISLFHQSRAFVTIDELTLTHHNHPKSIFYIMVQSWCFTAVGLDVCIMTCMYHYSIVQSIFTILKIFCVLPIHPFLPNTDNHWYFLPSPVLVLEKFGLFHNVV